MGICSWLHCPSRGPRGSSYPHSSLASLFVSGRGCTLRFLKKLPDEGFIVGILSRGAPSPEKEVQSWNMKFFRLWMKSQCVSTCVSV